MLDGQQTSAFNWALANGLQRPLYAVRTVEATHFSSFLSSPPSSPTDISEE